MSVYDNHIKRAKHLYKFFSLMSQQAHVRPAAMMDGLRTFLLLHVLACVGQTVHGGKIINGEKAPRNSLQYMVSLQNSRSHVCGGFLITRDFVLTSAQCSAFQLTHVFLGTHNINGNNYLKRGIDRSYLHPDYKVGKLNSDIMLIKLAAEVYVSERINTIAIPTSDIKTKVNQTCSVAGWGKMDPWGLVVSELRVVDMSVIDLGFCEKKWGFVLPSNVICADGGDTHRGACDGDSGGPLVCDGVAVGIASLYRQFSDCTNPSLPNVYTDISAYVPWIKEILKGKD